MLKGRDLRNRRTNGGFGHCIGKYRKNPAIQHNRDLEARADERRVTPIERPAATVTDAVKFYYGESK